MIRRNDREAEQRIADRRLRENQAPRLIDEVRRLIGLNINIDNAGQSYVWRIVVERAPALFEIACSERSCTDGGHDLTRQITQALRSASPRFEGKSTCRGDVPGGNCDRVLTYVAEATYRDG